MDEQGSSGEVAPTYRLGVLVVHGIGEQKQGETLNQFASPIVSWLDQWLSEDVQATRLIAQGVRNVPVKPVTGEAVFISSSLRPPDLETSAPAHAAARVLTKGRDETDDRWLFAESWWSPQTLTPAISPFLLWLITRGPWIALAHLGQVFDVDYERLSSTLTSGKDGLGEFVRCVIASLLWLGISLALVLLWCLVSLVALVPLGFVRRRVYDALQAITGVVGDSYVLINEPIQRAAFVHSTRKALLWLRDQKCAKLAVVAHSQGAVIARDALLADNDPQVALLVTLGPGIAKVDALAEQERLAPRVFLLTATAAPLAAVALLSFIRLRVSGQTGFSLWGFPLVAASLSFLATHLAWTTTAFALKTLRTPDLTGFLLKRRQAGMKWRDFYASHDPVSNGSLATTFAAGVRRIVSHRALVRASLLADHTNYWTSAADFVPRVVRALAACAGIRLGTDAAGKRRLRNARAQFVASVYLLRVLRWIDLLALVVPLWRFSLLKATALDLRNAVEGLPFASVATFLEGFENALAWASSLVLGPVLVDTATNLMLLATLAGAALFVWRKIVVYWWQVMAPLGLMAVFRPSDATFGAVSQALLGFMVLSLGLVPVALSITWTVDPGAIAWHNLDWVLGLMAALFFSALYTVLVAALGYGTWQTVSQHRSRPSTPAAPLRFADVWPLAVGWLLFGLLGGALLLMSRFGFVLPGVVAFALVTCGVYWKFATSTPAGRRR